VGFEYFFKKYRQRAYFHAVSLLGNPEDAVDACQESFTRAYQAIARLDHLDNFYPWFYRILRNCCLNMISRRKTVTRYRQDLQMIERQTNPAGSDVLLEKREEQVRVWQVLGELKPEFREILIMKYIEGCRYEEIALRLAIPRGTVMSRLYHARMAFGREYTESTEPDARGRDNHGGL
jgi:RNA polymerase sigma-70 factor (ECF subfamily)